MPRGEDLDSTPSFAGPARGVACAVALALSPALLASCGSGTAPPAIPSGRVPGLTSRAGLPPHHGPGSTVRVTLSGLTLYVTVKRVFDPLTDSGARTPAGTTPVGVLISVHSAGPATYDSSATSDFALLTPSGPAMAVFAPAGACQTYVQDFMNELGPGDARTGCIAYAIRREQRPTAVRFAAYGGHQGRAVEWQLPVG